MTGGDLRNETPEKVFPFKFTLDFGDDRSHNYMSMLYFIYQIYKELVQNDFENIIFFF